MNNRRTTNPVIRIIEFCIFSSRWILAALYLTLNIGLACYAVKFGQELVSMILHTWDATTEMTMLSLLGLVDITMVANLVILVNIAGYSIFIREIDPALIRNRPRFMSHITAAGLKIKLGQSLVGVSSIHLLKVFIHAASAGEGGHEQTINWYNLSMLVVVHVVFLASTVALAVTDRLTHGTRDNHEKENDNEESESHSVGGGSGTNGVRA